MFSALAVSLVLAAAAPAVVLPEGEALKTAIAASDAEFFQVFFVGCDPAKVASMLTPDFEMYHDKGGLVTTSAAPFVAQYAKDCEAKKKPDAWRSRRELVPGSLRVWPIPGYGAFEDGEHVFYERKGDGPEKLVGHARFTQVWRLGPDGWRIARVLSFDHSAVE
ncbi:MAG TPA: nuclear transport factor 2 family protein [Caulobacteraceae bacterium]|jgi:hypothetical protein